MSETITVKEVSEILAKHSKSTARMTYSLEITAFMLSVDTESNEMVERSAEFITEVMAELPFLIACEILTNPSPEAYSQLMERIKASAITKTQQSVKTMYAEQFPTDTILTGVIKILKVDITKLDVIEEGQTEPIPALDVISMLPMSPTVH